VLRFANVCFGAIWNRHYIKSVQVIFKEDFGTEGRAGYFDQYGIIRDVMQNHLMQMVALVAMEQPLSFSAEHIRAEKLKVLHSIVPLRREDVVTGQYEGYLDELPPDARGSKTETFCAGVLHVHTPRWDGVPFVLKAGKALNECKVELRVQFHSVPGVVSALRDCTANELVVRVQPQEDIYWKVQNKSPGLAFAVEQMRMDLTYKVHQDYDRMPAAYERLLLEALAGDHSHFVSEEELEASWRIFTPVLRDLASGAPPDRYTCGGRGPAAADALARRHGMSKFGGGLTKYVHLAAGVAKPPEPSREPSGKGGGAGGARSAAR
jgi:glucose-6-phosphate 1-dehydrogenase